MKFTEMKLILPIQKAIAKTGYVTATPIQEKSIPHILEKKDLMGIAQTGTGKTAAFTLPILQLMFENANKGTKAIPKTLILAPTRELALQIDENIKEYSEFTGFKTAVIFGGVKQSNQQRILSRGVDIIVATPGRLLDLMQQGIINLSTIEYFILDEADRMLDMGFLNDVKKIAIKVPKKRQTLFFSATMSKEISALAGKFLNNPLKVEITPEGTTTKRIEQSVYYVDKDDKNKLLHQLLRPEEITTALVFTKTKHKANKIAEFLTGKNIISAAIHGNKSQAARVDALNKFKEGKVKVLVATDIMARGIDVDNISHVINYELPNEPENYVHRIGRTARAGSSGIAHSFCSAEERDYFRDIEKLIKKKITVIDHPKHSDAAEKATGADAKPPKKKPFVRSSKQKNNGEKPLKKKVIKQFKQKEDKQNKRFEDKRKKAEYDKNSNKGNNNSSYKGKTKKPFKK